MMKKNIISILLLALVASFGLSSCEDMLTPDMDRHDEVDEIASDTLYSYWGILKSLQNIAERYVILGECRGDLVNGTAYVSDSIHSILDFGRTGDISDGACRYLKASDFYHVINSCNTYMAQCDTLIKTGTNQSVMLKEYAQVASIRAWVYMQLVLAYGEVPYFEEPMLSTASIDHFWSEVKTTVNADRLAESGVVKKLEEVRNVDTPDYGSYGRTIKIADATQCLFPQNIVLGDIYLLRAKQGDEASYRQAAQYYYDFLNTNVGGTINPQNYYGLQVRSRLNDQMSPTTAGIYWLQMFTSTNPVNYNNEKVTVIPSSVNKLWGTVLRGVNDLFGATTKIAVSTNSEDTVTNVSISLSLNYEHELGPSPLYKNLCSSQNYEAYIGTDTLTTVVEGGGDTRYKLCVQNYINEDQGTDEAVPFVVKQNAPSNLLAFPMFCTSYPIIYRKGTIWLHFAEALNGAGFPGYAFAILKSGLCGNSSWLPTSITQYDSEGSNYFIEDEIAVTYFEENDSTARDTTFYPKTSDLVRHLRQRAFTEGVSINTDDDLLKYMTELSTKTTVHPALPSWKEWPSADEQTLVCYHIPQREMKNAKSAPFLNFQTLYLRGQSLYTYIAGGDTPYQLIESLYPVNTSEPVTMGIHNRGCGMIKYDERFTTFNYIDQINKMLATMNEEALTKEEIYQEANLEKVKKAIATLILDEMALETSFEGNRFFDLLCYSRFCGNNDELAKRIANRSGVEDGALRSYLQNSSNWYFKLPQK